MTMVYVIALLLFIGTILFLAFSFFEYLVFEFINRFK